MSVLLKIEVNRDPYDDCSYGCNCEDNITYKPVTIEDLLKEMTEYDLQNLGLIRVDTKKGITDVGKQSLKRYGWVHAESALSRAEKKVMEEKFYLIDPKRDPRTYTNTITDIQDMSDMPHHQIEEVANGSLIVQKVTAKSVMTPADYKKYQAIIKKKEEAAEKAKATKQKRAEKLKQKEIDAAKQLLLEAGVQVLTK